MNVQADGFNEVMGDNVPHLNSFLPSGIQGFKETLPRMDLCQMGT